MLDLVSVPATSGASPATAYENIGTVQNKGWEFTLKWSDKINKDWSYHISGNITFNHNEVLSLNGGEAIYSGDILSQEYSTITTNGQPIGEFYLLKVLGVFQNQAQIDNYKNAQGQLLQPNAHPGDLIYQGGQNDSARVYAGSYQPKFLLWW